MLITPAFSLGSNALMISRAFKAEHNSSIFGQPVANYYTTTKRWIILASMQVNVSIQEFMCGLSRYNPEATFPLIFLFVYKLEFFKSFHKMY